MVLGKELHLKKIALLLIALALGVAPALARDYSVGTLKIETPWVPASPQGAAAAAGYMEIENTGQEADRLIGGSMLLAGRVQIHEMSLQDGVMKMQELAGGLNIKPGESVALKPGSFHIMFLDLKEPIKPGAPIKGTLTFEKSGTIEIEYQVEPMAGQRAFSALSSFFNVRSVPGKYRCFS